MRRTSRGVNFFARFHRIDGVRRAGLFEPIMAQTKSFDSIGHGVIKVTRAGHARGAKLRKRVVWGFDNEDITIKTVA
jgi:hypothetical protein